MYTTEKEAKQKICPRTISPPTKGYDENLCSACMGSQCMAWRWSGDVATYKGIPIRLGYCGLAKKVNKCED